MQQLNESSNGQEMQLHSGEKFEIGLSENPTTGFRWSMVSNGEPACKVLDDVYEPPDGHTHGKEGTHSWRFEAVQTGHGKIELAYQRSWEHKENAARRFTLGVRVIE